MATQRIFDPLYTHREHFAVSKVASISSTSDAVHQHQHQPHSSRELPHSLQQLLFELCCTPYLQSRSIGLDSIIQYYDLASFLGVSVTLSSTLTLHSAFDTCLADPFPYRGIPRLHYPADWTMAKMREVANSKPRTRLAELFPCHYLDYDEIKDIELIKHVDSISSYVEHPVPDHWMRYMIDLMRDRVIWIGATNRGELIGITRHGFEKLTHRSSPARPEVCTCQANVVSVDLISSIESKYHQHGKHGGIRSIHP